MTLTALRKRWFLIALGVLIPGGLWLGCTLSDGAVSGLLRFSRPRLVTAAVLFLMSFSLDNRHLRASLRAPGPVIWATFVNFGLIPLAAMLFAPWQLTEDFRVGLMIAASVPCTMAAASVWTRKAGGNDAVSLLVTFVTNAGCFAVTPLWLAWSIGRDVDIEGLSLGSLTVRLVQAVLIPCILGQALRLLPAAADLATRRKTLIGVVAQSLILTLVFSSSLRSGAQLAIDGPKPDLAAVALVWGSCIVIHLFGMAIGVIGGRKARFSDADVAAIAFASSQKTLPIGILIAATYGQFMNVPFAVFPMLMYHSSQLFIDTVIADKLRPPDAA